MLHAGIRESKYYSQRNDSLSIQAQTQRSRSANTDENHQKMFDELMDLYRRTVPGETSPEKAKKHEALLVVFVGIPCSQDRANLRFSSSNSKKSANEARMKSKKHLSAKKASRKGFSD